MNETLENSQFVIISKDLIHWIFFVHFARIFQPLFLDIQLCAYFWILNCAYHQWDNGHDLRVFMHCCRPGAIYSITTSVVIPNLEAVHLFTSRINYIIERTTDTVILLSMIQHPCKSWNKPQFVTGVGWSRHQRRLLHSNNPSLYTFFTLMPGGFWGRCHWYE